MKPRRRPFLVNVASLRGRPGSSQREHVEGPLPGLAMPDSWVPEGAEVGLDALIESASGGIVVVGEIHAPWVGECRRCMGTATGTLEVEVRELFASGAAGADPELSYPYSGDQLDLEPMVRDAVLLELPQVPLCRPDCGGLCPTCGAELNTEECSCGPGAADGRWSALNVLRAPAGRAE
jgi:uncharacterized protein